MPITHKPRPSSDFDKRTELDLQLFLLTKGIVTSKIRRGPNKTPDFTLPSGEALEVTNIHSYTPMKLVEFNEKRKYDYGWNAQVSVSEDDGTIKIEEGRGQYCQKDLSVLTCSFDVSSYSIKIKRAIEKKYPQIVSNGGLIAITFRTISWSSEKVKREVERFLLLHGHKYPMLAGLLVGVPTNMKVAWGIVEWFLVPNRKRSVDIPKCIWQLTTIPESKYKKPMMLLLTAYHKKAGYNSFQLPPMLDDMV